MTNYKVKVGIIGGSGLDHASNQIFYCEKSIKREEAKNEFGLPSSDLQCGTVANINVVLLSRHGQGHKITPSNINYKANIEALRIVGCTHIIASTACGSLVESIDRGSLVIPDSFIDRTFKRNGTFFDNSSSNYPGVCHLPMEPAFDKHTAAVLIQAAREIGLDVRDGGTIVTIEGPRFSSKAESNALRLWGGHLVNMTTCPEVFLAKEAGLLYSAIAVATDYDCWRECDDKVHPAEVIKVFKHNINKVTDLIVKTVELIGKENWVQDIDNLKELISSSNISHG